MLYREHSAPPQQSKSWRDVIKVHPAADLFPRMAEQDLRELGNDIRERGLVSPIVIFREVGTNGVRYSLLDGISRLDAMEMARIKFEFQLSKNGEWVIRSSELSNIDDDVVRCRYVCDDPFDFVLSANVRRRHLSTEQKRDLIAKVLKAQPEKSNRTIAKQIKADDKTVAAVRSKLETTAEIPQLTKTVGADGKARTTTPTKKKRRDVDDYIAEKKARLAGAHDADATDLADTTALVETTGSIDTIRSANILATATDTIEPVDTAQSPSTCALKIHVHTMITELLVLGENYSAVTATEWHQAHPDHEVTAELVKALKDAARQITALAQEIEGRSFPFTDAKEVGHGDDDLDIPTFLDRRRR